MNIKQFNPVEFIKNNNDGFFAMIVAPRRTGKTCLTEDLISKFQPHRKWDEAYLFSRTAFAQDCYNFIPKENKFNYLDTNKLSEIFKSQQQNQEDYRDGMIDKKKRVLIIADDIIGTKEARNSPEFNDLSILGRHFRLDVFSLSQTIKGFSPMTRSNSDLIITWRCLKFEDREITCEDFLMIESGKKSEIKKKAIEILNKIAEKQYRCCVIEKHISSYAKTASDYVRWYLAEPKVKIKNIGKHKSKKKKIVNCSKNVIDHEGKPITLNMRIRKKIKKNKR